VYLKVSVNLAISPRLLKVVQFFSITFIVSDHFRYTLEIFNLDYMHHWCGTIRNKLWDDYEIFIRAVPCIREYFSFTELYIEL
jgi:hypothetical protein